MIGYELISPPEDITALKETTNKFSSKLIVNELVTINSENPYTESTTITTLHHGENISKILPYFDERIEHMSVNKRN